MFKRSLFEFRNNTPRNRKGGFSPQSLDDPSRESQASVTLDPNYPLTIIPVAHPLLVKASVKIIKLLEINTNANTFQADFTVSLKWEDDSFMPVVRGEVRAKSAKEGAASPTLRKERRKPTHPANQSV
jgi:hypothetical protein